MFLNKTLIVAAMGGTINYHGPTRLYRSYQMQPPVQLLTGVQDGTITNVDSPVNKLRDLIRGIPAILGVEVALKESDGLTENDVVKLEQRFSGFCDKTVPDILITVGSNRQLWLHNQIATRGEGKEYEESQGELFMQAGLAGNRIRVYRSPSPALMPSFARTALLSLEEPINLKRPDPETIRLFILALEQLSKSSPGSLISVRPE